MRNRQQKDQMMACSKMNSSNITHQMDSEYKVPNQHYEGFMNVHCHRHRICEIINPNIYTGLLLATQFSERTRQQQLNIIDKTESFILTLSLISFFGFQYQQQTSDQIQQAYVYSNFQYQQRQNWKTTEKEQRFRMKQTNLINQNQNFIQEVQIHNTLALQCSQTDRITSICKQIPTVSIKQYIRIVGQDNDFCQLQTRSIIDSMISAISNQRVIVLDKALQIVNMANTRNKGHTMRQIINKEQEKTLTTKGLKVGLAKGQSSSATKIPEGLLRASLYFKEYLTEQISGRVVPKQTQNVNKHPNIL